MFTCVLFCASNMCLCAGTFEYVCLCLLECMCVSGVSWNTAILYSLMARNHSGPLPALHCPPYIQCCISITLLLPYIQSSNYIAVNLTQAILLRLMVAIVFKSEHTHFLSYPYSHCDLLGQILRSLFDKIRIIIHNPFLNDSR